MLAAPSEVLPPLGARSVLTFTAPANLAWGLNPKCHSTERAM